MKLLSILTGASLVCLATAAAAEPMKKPAADPRAAEFFERRIRPLLAERCFSCHGPKKEMAGLRLDTRESLLKGSDNGPVIVLGQPDRSRLVRAVRHEGDVKMPPKMKLPAEAIADLTRWVQMGVPWPETSTSATAPLTVAEVRKRHWAFQPVRKPALPAVRNPAWVLTDLDRFVLARLEANNLAPSPAADRRTLLRRASFDLTGLPPTPEEMEAFAADRSPNAFARVVDRLLSSPRYGERWGRHWLDVARYADTRGYVFTEERRFPFAYTYRDYVIRAFNEDLPYDQFILHQLAADRLLPLTLPSPPRGEGRVRLTPPSPPSDGGEGRVRGVDRRPLAAMGFLTLGRRFLNNVPDIIDDRIDVTMRGLQGMTVACARCHDHKFDPIPQKDYYSLYGVFASSVEPRELPSIAAPVPGPEYETFARELERLQKEVAGYKQKHRAELQANNRKFHDELRGLQKKVDHLRATHPGAPASAMVLVDAPQPMQPHVFLRGNPNNRGPAVPRQYLQVLAGDDRKPFTDGSGRLELARAIASKDNPLTARVLVNRVWMWHFGQGLVRTPSDFGLRGEPPTHPELLDYLAATFVENGWSLKKLHRLIVLSSVYRQQSEDRADGRRLDIDNRLLWKMNRQRLDFESLRDSLLAVAGRLDLRVGGPAVSLTDAPFAARRSVYGFIDRQNLPGLFRTFDFASPDAHVPMRHTTTVPQQALFLMNSPFLIEQCRHLIARPDVANCAGTAQRIDRLYRLLYGRGPETDEVALGVRFVARAGGKGLSAWEQYAQVLLLANEFVFVD